MTDYVSSSQSNAWIFTKEELLSCHRRANYQATEFLIQQKKDPQDAPTLRPFNFAVTLRKGDNTTAVDGSSMQIDDPDETIFLTHNEEAELVRFYAGKIPFVVGPQAQISRLRFPEKVSATAGLLFRRFYLSNSVMMFDPKTIMIAAAFLASKVEDTMADVRYFEEATKLMEVPVSVEEILIAELALVSGVNFDVMCFHSFKPVLALTEDIGTYLKSEKGRNAISGSRIVTGGDLRPRYEIAKKMVDDVCVSDIPLLYSPGKIGLAALIVANDDIQAKAKAKGNDDFPKIDLYGYLDHRFESTHSKEECVTIKDQVSELAFMIRKMKDGKYGCGNHAIDMATLKPINKKLKKCRLWGRKEKSKSKKKKRKSVDEDATRD